MRLLGKKQFSKLNLQNLRRLSQISGDNFKTVFEPVSKETICLPTQAHKSLWKLFEFSHSNKTLKETQQNLKSRPKGAQVWVNSFSAINHSCQSLRGKARRRCRRFRQTHVSYRRWVFFVSQSMYVFQVSKRSHSGMRKCCWLQLTHFCRFATKRNPLKFPVVCICYLCDLASHNPSRMGFLCSPRGMKLWTDRISVRSVVSPEWQVSDTLQLRPTGDEEFLNPRYAPER